MAAPITHIVLANKVFDDFFPKLSKKEFLIGTSFPDIRYLKIIGRKATHFKNTNLSLQALNQENSFVAGAKFHAMADLAREKFISSQNTYFHLPKSKYARHSFKFLEDELLFHKIDNWPEIIEYFKYIPYEQIPFNLNSDYIDKWYALIYDYISSGPNPQSRKKFIQELGLKEEEADKINELLEIIKNNKRFHKTIYGLFDNFGLVIQKLYGNRHHN